MSEPTKVTVKQPVINVARALLNQEGYVKDFEDFYHAGEALSVWPKMQLLPANVSEADMDKLLATDVDWCVEDRHLAILKKALKHYIDQKKQCSEHHFALMKAFGLNPKSSLT